MFGTTGRIRDCLSRSYLSLSNCTYIVIDEADKILKDRFEEDLKYILDSMIAPNNEINDREDLLRLIESNKIRTISMLSATMPRDLEVLARTYLKSPYYIEIPKENTDKNINQLFNMVTSNSNKFDKLRKILKEYKPPIIRRYLMIIKLNI